MQTTRSWQFGGVETPVEVEGKKDKDLLHKAKYGKDVIAGILDSGN